MILKLYYLLYFIINGSAYTILLFDWKLHNFALVMSSLFSLTKNIYIIKHVVVVDVRPKNKRGAEAFAGLHPERGK